MKLIIFYVRNNAMINVFSYHVVTKLIFYSILDFVVDKSISTNISLFQTLQRIINLLMTNMIFKRGIRKLVYIVPELLNKKKKHKKHA